MAESDKREMGCACCKCFKRSPEPNQISPSSEDCSEQEPKRSRCGCLYKCKKEDEEQSSSSYIPSSPTDGDTKDKQPQKLELSESTSKPVAARNAATVESKSDSVSSTEPLLAHMTQTQTNSHYGTNTSTDSNSHVCPDVPTIDSDKPVVTSADSQNITNEEHTYDELDQAASGQYEYVQPVPASYEQPIQHHQHDQPVQHAYDQTGQPASYEQPIQRHQYDQPAQHAYDQPQTGQYGQPASYEQPIHHQYDQPAQRTYDQPQADQYGQPVSYEQPLQHHHQYDQPGQYGQPVSYEQPLQHHHQYDQPGQYGQPVSYEQPLQRHSQHYQPTLQYVEADSGRQFPKHKSEPNLPLNRPTDSISGYHSHSTAHHYNPSKPYYSFTTIENARYSVDHSDYTGPSLSSRSEHPNDDRVFVYNAEGQATIMAVFDGHDGSNASAFASSYMQNLFQSPQTLMQLNQSYVDQILTAIFLETENEFFRRIQHLIAEKKELQRLIPQNMSSYEAQQFFPEYISRIQEIEPELAGGTTVVVAIIVNGSLYVANAGDSRAVLVRKTPNGIITEQLSTDHTVDNPNELERLSQLGLNKEELKRSGRLGTQENTRCIGDFNIKKGYKDVDVLSCAKDEPGLCMPDIRGPIPIDPSCQYLLLMTDGVYKSLENLTHPPTADHETMNNLLHIIQFAETTCQSNLSNVAAEVLENIKDKHGKTYFENAKMDIRSPLAVECRKRDDMTLIVLSFGNN